MSAGFVCAGGCRRPVKAIYCEECWAKREKDRAMAAEQAAAEAAERMKNPEFQRRLQEGRDRATAERKAQGVKRARRKKDSDGRGGDDTPAAR